MDSNYDLTKHIQRLEVSPQAEDILDQREITIQSYTTTATFNFDHIINALEGAWLSPKTRFGVFSHPMGIDNSPEKDAINVVLGLQDELSIRAYDYSERRPLWFSWKNVIVDTVKVHYFRNHDDDLLHFTTTGGGRRIKDRLIEEFNSDFLGIPKEAVTKKQFDSERLRDMCFTRFIDQLYMIRFSDPKSDEYKSIEEPVAQTFRLTADSL